MTTPSSWTAYEPHPGRFDELREGGGQLRPHWHTPLQAFESLGPAELARRWEHVRRLLRESGVTYNVYTDGAPPERLWRLDPLPIVLAEAEWRRIEDGLVQRAELLDLILADLYGPRRLVRDGVIPAELVYGHPGFLLPSVGLSPAGPRHLIVYAADLARAPSGDFCVTGDRAQAPSGVGYAIENRIVLSRALPGVFRDTAVQRLAPFLGYLRTALNSAAPAGCDDPRAVLLTPGAASETYFEHALLSSHLGCTLAQGDDLVVRDERVWLKTLDRLEPVDVILRRVDDSFCDPLELRPDSLLGVPGLLQAARQRQVGIANPLGSGILEHPGLMAFLPACARELLGEDLALASVPTWWCGDPEALSHVLANLESLVVKSVGPHRSAAPVRGLALSAAERANLADAIRSRPHMFAAQEHVPLSTAPVVTDSGLEPRTMALRCFLAGGEDAYAVMPGGLCRVAPSRTAWMVSNQFGGGSKDVWVIAGESVVESGLLRADRAVRLHRRGEDEVSGRVADNLFWVWRYAERGEGSARLLREVLRRVLEPDAVRQNAQLATVLQALTLYTGVRPGFIGEGAEERIDSPEAELLAAIFDAGRVGSLRFNVAALSRAARALRDRLPADCWRALSRLEDELQSTTDPSQALERVQGAILVQSAFTALATASMTRGHAWCLLEVGRHLERAWHVVVLLRALGGTANSSHMVAWEVALAATQSLLTYRRRYGAMVHGPAVLDLLLDDESNPRSLAYQMLQLDALIDDLAAGETRVEVDEPRVQMSEALAELRSGLDLGADLDDTFARVLAALAACSNAITSRYFGHAEGPRQLAGVA